MLCVVVVWCCRFKEWLHSVAIALASDDLSMLLELLLTETEKPPTS
jgi:hypothetical protein